MSATGAAMSERRPRPMDVGEIENMLEARISALCLDLFPNGDQRGHEYLIGSLAGEKGSSLSIHTGPAKLGRWKDFAGGSVGGRDGGDLLWLVACALFGGDLGKAVAWSKSWLGLDDEDPERLEQHRLEAVAAGEKREAASRANVERAQASARKRWHMGVPINGTIAEIYLATRGIDLRALGRTPGALRFNPSVQYGFAAKGDPPAPLLPAMLACVNNLAGEHVATHRTWLKLDGSGKAGPEEGVAKPKKVLGPFLGGHIALWKGACGSMPLRDIPAGTDVYCSEGIEDGLAAACADPSLRIVAGISVGNFAELELPTNMGWLIFLKQNDPPGSDAEKAFFRAVAAQRARGRRIKIAPPPSDVKDVTELAERAKEAA